MHMTKLVAAFALTLGLSTGAQAGVSFDPDGPYGSATVIDVGTFDWGPTNLLALGANTAIANFLAGTCPPGGCTFTLYTMATLIGTKDQSGTINTPSGLNTDYEITAIAGFTEVITGAFGSTVFFSTVTSDPGFLQIFFDLSIDSNDLTGYGFNDGDLILQGTTVGPATSNFTTTGTSPLLLDQSPDGNQYGPSPVTTVGTTPCTPGVDQCTLPGFGGSGNIPVDTLVTDPNFFLTPLALFGIQFANISLGLPYITVNPADCYTIAPSAVPVVGTTSAPNAGCTTLHSDTLMALQDIPPPPGYLPNIGFVNAAFGLGGPDFVAQTDFNSTLTPAAAVPEPGSLALLGLGLGALGLAGFRRRGLRLN